MKYKKSGIRWEKLGKVLTTMMYCMAMQTWCRIMKR